MKDTLNICSIQSSLVWEDKDANINNFEENLKDFDKGYADIILFPEMFNTGFSINPSLAEDMNGKSVNYLQEKASKLDAVVMATLMIKEDDKVYNRLVCVYPNGEIKHYDKRHLFCLSDENKLLTKGTNYLIVDVKGWMIKPLICYDLRFPVWSKNVSGNEYEYDVLIYLANWPSARDYHWETLLKARAIENQSYVIGLNRIGVDGRGIDHCGNSMCVDFRGYTTEIANKTHRDKSVMIFDKLDYNSLKEYRESFPTSKDWDYFILVT